MAIKVVTLKDKDNNEIFPYGVGDTLKNILDLFYPVGSYYETSSTTFNPNTTWSGTTWVEDTAGRVLVSKGSGNFTTVGATGGENEHTIKNSELPYAEWTIPHVAYMEAQYSGSGIITAGRSSTHSSEGKGEGARTGDGTSTNSHMYSFGKSTPDKITNIQPYIVIRRWHRTA